MSQHGSIFLVDFFNLRFFIKIFHSLHAQLLIHGNSRKIATAVLTVEPLIPAASLHRGPLMSLQSGSKNLYSNLNKKTR